MQRLNLFFKLQANENPYVLKIHNQKHKINLSLKNKFE